MDYWSVEVMYYDDGHQEFNTYMVKAQDQNDAMNKAHHRFEKAHPTAICLLIIMSVVRCATTLMVKLFQSRRC